MTDIPLTEHGIEQVKETAKGLTGPGREWITLLNLIFADLCIDIIDPKNLCTVHVSPRQRATKTFELLFEHLEEKPRYVLDEEVQEWNYGTHNKRPWDCLYSRCTAGDYEGLKPAEIKALNPVWTIWNDGYVYKILPFALLILL